MLGRDTDQACACRPTLREMSFSFRDYKPPRDPTLQLRTGPRKVREADSHRAHSLTGPHGCEMLLLELPLDTMAQQEGTRGLLRGPTARGCTLLWPCEVLWCTGWSACTSHSRLNSASISASLSFSSMNWKAIWPRTLTMTGLGSRLVSSIFSMLSTCAKGEAASNTFRNVPGPRQHLHHSQQGCCPVTSGQWVAQHDLHMRLHAGTGCMRMGPDTPRESNGCHQSAYRGTPFTGGPRSEAPGTERGAGRVLLKEVGKESSASGGKQQESLQWRSEFSRA